MKQLPPTESVIEQMIRDRAFEMFYASGMPRTVRNLVMVHAAAEKFVRAKLAREGVAR